MNDVLTRRAFFGFVTVVMLLAAPGSVSAFDFDPTPIAKALAAHDLVLVAKVKERAGGMVKIVPVQLIKGKAPIEPIALPDTWRPGTEFTFGPVRFEVGSMYLFMLNGARAPYSLSKDFAAPAALRVDSEKVSLVRATVVLHALAQQEKTDGRKQVLAEAWESENEKTKQELLNEFWLNPADSATVPFLVKSINASNEQYSLVELAGLGFIKHKYREAIPDLLKVVKYKSGEPGSLHAAYALGAMKVKDAYEPILALIDDPKTYGPRESLIEALGKLEDQRAAPFLIKQLSRNFRGLDPAHGSYRSWSYRENEAAVTGLGRLRAVEAVDPLMQLLTLEAPGYQDLRTRVVWALGEIGPPAKKALPRIRELMQAERVLKETADEALQKIER